MYQNLFLLYLVELYSVLMESFSGSVYCEDGCKSLQAKYFQVKF